MKNRGRKNYKQLDDETLTHLAQQGENPTLMSCFGVIVHLSNGTC